MGRYGNTIRSNQAVESTQQRKFMGHAYHYFGKRKDWKKEFVMPKSILIVEDNQDAIRILQDRLEVWGYAVIIAHAADEGLRKLKKDHVAGVIFELRIPIEDSLKTLSQFHQQYPHVPIIVTSEETQRSALIEALEQGASDYMIKPLDFELLQEKCQRLFA